MTPSRTVNIADLRRLAKRRLPKVVFDYVDGGAESEVTLRENCRAFDEVTFRPRGAVAAPTADLQTSVLGTRLRPPVSPRSGGKHAHALSARRGGGREGRR